MLTLPQHFIHREEELHSFLLSQQELHDLGVHNDSPAKEVFFGSTFFFLGSLITIASFFPLEPSREFLLGVTVTLSGLALVVAVLSGFYWRHHQAGRNDLLKRILAREGFKLDEHDAANSTASAPTPSTQGEAASRDSGPEDNELAAARVERRALKRPWAQVL